MNPPTKKATPSGDDRQHRIATFLEDVPALVKRSSESGGPPCYLPTNKPLREQTRCNRREDAERVGLEAEYDAAVKRDADLQRELATDLARLAKEARLLAPMLYSMDLEDTPLLALARLLEAGPDSDFARLDGGYWPNVRVAFDNALPSLDCGRSRLGGNVPAKSGLRVGILRDKLGASDEFLRSYAMAAGVPTPKPGKRNHTYAHDEVVKICQHVMASSSEKKKRDAAQKLLVEMSK
jgi:hypothetical protein